MNTLEQDHFVEIDRALQDAGQAALRSRLEQIAAELKSVRFREGRLQRDKQVLSSLLAHVSHDLENALLLQKRFIASVSHEIRTPLNAIMGFLDLLADTPLMEQQAEWLRNSQVSSQHLMALINDVLDVSKVEAGQIELSQQKVSLEDVLFEAVTLVSTRIDPSRVRMKVEVPDLDYFVMADPVRIRQVVLNLLSNAAKFTEQGSIRLSLGHEALGEGLVRFTLVITDTGMGIPAAQMERLFTPFVQAHFSANHEGTGLGLYLSRSLARLMGGDIVLASEEGRGTTCTVTLNLLKAADKSRHEHLSGCRVLLLLGQSELRDDLARQLEHSGLKVVLDDPQVGAVAALNQAIAEPGLGAVVMDMDRYGDAAVPLAGMINVALPQLGVIGMHHLAGRKVPPLGFDVLLTKPVSMNRLLGALGELTAKRPQHAQKVDVSNLSVLVVEDVELNARLINEMLLRYFGIKCAIARDGLEAVAAVQDQRFDLILMDIQMPNMDGIEATRAILTLYPGQAIVALSANAFVEDVDTARAAGMEDFITKPVRMDALERVLYRHAARLQPAAEVVEQRVETGNEKRETGNIAGVGRVSPQGVTRQETEAPPASLADRLAAARAALVAEYGDEVGDELYATALADLKKLMAGLVTHFSAHETEDARRQFHGMKSVFALLEIAEGRDWATQADLLLKQQRPLEETEPMYYALQALIETLPE